MTQDMKRSKDCKGAGGSGLRRLPGYSNGQNLTASGCGKGRTWVSSWSGLEDTWYGDAICQNQKGKSGREM